MKQDQLLYGLIGALVGLVAGVLITKHGASPQTNATPTPPVARQIAQPPLEPPKTEMSSPSVPRESETGSPANPPKQQQEMKLPQGHPSIQGKSVQEQIAALEEKVKKDPQNQTALIALGNLNADSGNIPKAADWYLKSLANDPNNVGLMTDLGTCYLRMQDFDKAFEYYRKSLSIDPNHYQTLVNLGILYMNTGEKQKAADTWEKVITLYPNDSRAAMLKNAIQKIRAEEQKK